MKIKFKIVLYATMAMITIVIVVVFLFLGFSYLNEYRPSGIENIEISYTGHNQKSLNQDTLSIVSWNIGYAGYEQSMDFFYDGGTHVRTTRENTERNLQGIIATLKKYREIDFILLQEVDISSKRSYGINILDSIAKAFPDYSVCYAPNFRCGYVPIPLCEPIGKVECGLAILSRYKPEAVRRHQLPNHENLPTRIFNLKRCLLESSFILPGGTDSLWIVNVHNSAYDDGTMREKEIGYIDSIVHNRKYCFICGDWNSNPPGYTPSRKETGNIYFRPYHISSSDINGVNFLVDTNSHTMRYLYEPYRKGHTTESLIDFAVSTKNIEELVTKTYEEHNFMYSDHNPVYYQIQITYPEAESR